MDNLTLNDFKKKIILKELSEFDIVAILEERHAGSRSVYNLFVLYEGYIFPVSVPYYVRFRSKNLTKFNTPDLNEFIASVRNAINEKISYASSNMPFDKPVSRKEISDRSYFLKYLINEQIELYSAYNLFHYKEDIIDFESELFDSCIAYFSKGLTMNEAYDKFMEKLEVDNGVIQERLKSCNEMAEF